MGGADIVPGVSGGTVALILGIYERLVTAISHFDLRLLRLLRQRQWIRAAIYVDLPFLIPLGAGILLGFVIMTTLMNHLLTTERTRSLTLAAFFGLIFASGFLVATMIKDTSWGQRAAQFDAGDCRRPLRLVADHAERELGQRAGSAVCVCVGHGRHLCDDSPWNQRRDDFADPGCVHPSDGNPWQRCARSTCRSRSSDRRRFWSGVRWGSLRSAKYCAGSCHAIIPPRWLCCAASCSAHCASCGHSSRT